MDTSDKITVIVPAAGVGKRLGLGENKAFADLGGVPLLVRCLEMLADTDLVKEAIVVTGADDMVRTEALLREWKERAFPHMAFRLTEGGKERQDSVANGLALVEDETGYVAVHDGARPFAGKAVFQRTLSAARYFGAAIAAVPLKDTVKSVDGNGMVTGAPDRSALRAVQTPQIFEIGLLRRAYKALKENPFPVTDDASLVEALGEPVAVAEGCYENIKITTPEDLLLAEKILEKRGKC